MNYLDYVQMTKSQQFAYNVKSFFTGIPGAIVGFFAAVGRFFVGIFKWIANGFKGYGSRFSKGDGGTKLSYLIMGAGNMMHGQFVKGLFYLAAECAYIYFMAVFGLNQLRMLYFTGGMESFTEVSSYDEVKKEVVTSTINVTVYGTVGDTPSKKELVSNGLLGSTEKVIPGTDSGQVLLFGVLVLVITVAFFALYIMNTKSAYATYEVKMEGKKNPTFLDDVRSYFDEKFHITLLTIPVLGISIFTALPIIYTMFIAFTNFDRAHKYPAQFFWWVGLDNFSEVFVSGKGTSGVFFSILVWTLVWAVFATFTNYIAGIILALMINKKGIRFKGFWRTIFVITAAVPQFVSLLIMKLFLREGGGLEALFGGTKLHLLDNTLNARIVVIIVNLWVGIPYTMLITSGLLMNIPEDLYESARIDGANVVQQFFKITFPYIFFVTTPYLITTFVGNINNFNVIYLLTGGSTGNEVGDYAVAGAGSLDLLVTWLYKLSFDKQKYYLAAVIGLIIFIITATGSLITFNMSKASKNEEEFS